MSKVEQSLEAISSLTWVLEGPDIIQPGHIEQLWTWWRIRQHGTDEAEATFPRITLLPGVRERVCLDSISPLLVTMFWLA